MFFLILFVVLFFGILGLISVFLLSVWNVGVNMSMVLMTVGINVYNLVIEGIVSEKIWYDFMLFLKDVCFLLIKIVVYYKVMVFEMFYK